MDASLCTAGAGLLISLLTHARRMRALGLLGRILARLLRGSPAAHDVTPRWSGVLPRPAAPKGAYRASRAANDNGGALSMRIAPDRPAPLAGRYNGVAWIAGDAAAASRQPRRSSAN